ncbi:MAG: peptide chain release factor N(5)-glutamine methyltransferase [Bradymonadia bacterium]
MSNPNAPWTVRRIYQWTSGFFAERGLSSPKQDALFLIGDALGIDRNQVLLRFDQPLEEAELQGIRSRVKRRSTGEPVAYITGHKGFWTLDLKVDPRVLIPRPETERLVELALEALKVPPLNAVDAPRIVDVCTGSGCVALALASELPTARIAALDISPDALAVAHENVAALELTERVACLKGDLLAPVPADKPVELIVSNPPYIERGDIEQLMLDVRDHEPHLALDGGPDGFDLIRPLVSQAAERLVTGGRLLFEIGADQGPGAQAICEADDRFVAVKVHKDYGQRDRVVEAIRA